MSVSPGRGRLVAAIGAGLLLFVQMFAWSPLAGAQDPGEPVDLRGFATGQPAHVGVVEGTPPGGPLTRVVNAEVAWSGAAVDADADGLKGAKLNEVNRIFQPDKGGKLSYARGSGLELGVGTTPADPNQLALTALAEADAPPSSTAKEEIALEGLDPVAYASLLRGEAVANANDSGLVPDVCVLGDDISRGAGYAADVQLLDAGGDTAAPELDGPVVALDDLPPPGSDRAVSQSTSRMKLVPSGSASNFGLMAEQRQTIAPVTLLRADPNNELRLITIEVLGEWVLRVVANGKAGGASVFYGPGEASPQTNILRIIDSEAAEPLLLTFQQIFGDTGFNLPPDLDQLIDLSIGEDPRAIAKPGTPPDDDSNPAVAANGTSASAAVDVVRVRLLSNLPDLEVADIRVGHMEVSTEVPVGGINCPIPVTKTADPDNITIGGDPDTSHIEITVHNVYDCDLEDVVLTDRIRREEGEPDFRLVAAEPDPSEPDIPTGVISTADVVWNLGTIKKGETKGVSVDLQSAVSGGVIRDIAEAAGTFANCSGQDAAGLAIAGLNVAGLSVPVDVRIETPLTGAAATRTVATGGALAVAAAAAGLWLRRRHPSRA